MATRKTPTRGAIPTATVGKKIIYDPIKPSGVSETPAASKNDAYAAYLEYAQAVAAQWTQQLGVTKTVDDVLAAGGSWAFDPSVDAGAYRNMTSAIVHPDIHPGGGPATSGSTAPSPVAAGPVVSYGQVDNGVSSLAGYGFGDSNRYTQGAPAGGYAQPTISGGGAGTAPGIPGAAATASTSTGSANTSGLSTAQRNAWAYLKGILDQYGLGSLSQFVITELTAGRSQDEIALDLQQTPEFKAAFPEIAARKAAGLPAISPGEIVSYRNSAVQLMRAAGLPQGFYDSPQDVQSLISSDVSLSELNDRINAAKDATYNIDPAAQARLYQEFGLAPGSGALAAFFLDDKKALPLLQRQVQAAQIGGAADQVGYGGLNNATALDLAQAGVTSAQARQGFNTLGMEGQLFTGLPGENAQGIGQGQQLAAQFLGNVDAQQAIERRRQSRQAEFTDGGAFAGTSKGLGGLSAADAS